MADQLEQAQAGGKGDLAQLLSGKDTWDVA